LQHFAASSRSSLRGRHFSEISKRVKRLFIDFFHFAISSSFRVSRYVVGMARIIGGFKTSASDDLRKFTVSRSTADLVDRVRLNPSIPVQK